MFCGPQLSTRYKYVWTHFRNNIFNFFFYKNRQISAIFYYFSKNKSYKTVIDPKHKVKHLANIYNHQKQSPKIRITQHYKSDKTLIFSENHNRFIPTKLFQRASSTCPSIKEIDHFKNKNIKRQCIEM
jgi:hypothetical protein